MSVARMLAATLAALALVRALPAQGSTPAARAESALRVSVTLAAGALRLTANEGGGEYFRRRVTTGVSNAVAKAVGAPRERGDLRPEDDVYLLVFGRAPDGAPFARVVAPPSGALYHVYRVGRGDDGDGDEMDEVPLWDGIVAGIDTLRLVVAMLEHDAGAADSAAVDPVATRLALAEQVGLALAHRVVRDGAAALAAGDVRRALAIVAGDDDVVGAMQVDVRATAGKPQAAWRALDDARDKGHSRFMRGRPLKPRWFQLGGDGARYEVHLRVSAQDG